LLVVKLRFKRIIFIHFFFFLTLFNLFTFSRVRFQISWVRRRDWHILTSGMFTYTNDERFTVLHAEGSDDWTLQIKYVQKRDNGTYECQVSEKLLVGLSSSFVIVSTGDGSARLHGCTTKKRTISTRLRAIRCLFIL